VSGGCGLLAIATLALVATRFKWQNLSSGV